MTSRNYDAKYTPILQNGGRNPFDVSTNPFNNEDSIPITETQHSVRSSNPFDEGYEDIKLAPRKITLPPAHSFNPFDELIPPPPPTTTQQRQRQKRLPLSFHTESKQETNYRQQQQRPPAPPPPLSPPPRPRNMKPPSQSTSASSSSAATITASSSTPTFSSSERSQHRQKQTKFFTKLNKIKSKLQRDKYDQTTSVCLDPTDENAIVRLLVARRVYGYPGTNGGLFSNYRHYVYNNHPLLSICLLNTLNPFGRKQKILVFLNSLCFTIFITFLITETTFVPKLSTCRLPCNQFTPMNSTVTICSGGYNDGLSYEEYRKACSYYDSWMLTALCGICIVAYQSLLEFLATCGCLQGKKSFQNNCCGTRLKGCIEWFGGVMLSFCTVISVSLLIWAIVACYLLQVGYAILGNIVLSKLWSTGEWFVWSAPYFAYRYPLDRKHFYQRLLRHEARNSKHLHLIPSQSDPSYSV